MEEHLFLIKITNGGLQQIVLDIYKAWVKVHQQS